MVQKKKCDPHLPKCIQPRHWVWYTVFLLGLPGLIGCAIWFAVSPRDVEVFWGKIPIEARQELFATR